MPSPAELRDDAAGMGTSAEQKAELADELRRLANVLPEGTDQVAGAITRALWEGRAAVAADDALASSARRVRLAAEDLEEVAAELEAEAAGLRREAADIERQADDLETELEAEAS